MNLEEILLKYNIEIRNKNGRLRNIVDVLEDFYLKLTPTEYNKIMFEISEEEKEINVFDKSRNRKYKGVE